jgi:signal transduction histidine kinase
MSPVRPANILLVDDQASKLLSYEVILRDLGENLIKADSANAALEQLLRNEIALILIDVVMPDLNGFELAAMIRDHPRFQKIAIIFVSAVAIADVDQLKGYEYGAVDYVAVPVVPAVLRAKVRVFLDLYRKSNELEALNSELEQRVAERTAELALANAELERRVEARTRESEAAMARVHEMQKLESLGQLTGGLAHDFNNLLMAILANLRLLIKKRTRDQSEFRLLEAAIQGAERGAALTKRMLAFARRQELRPEAIDVVRLIDDMVEMLQRSLGPTVHIRLESEGEIWPIHADLNQLELAILNLALNARDAMVDGGELALEVQNDQIDASNILMLRPGDYVRVAITDTGCGMDEATLQRATEPFFTTKGVGKGTGLGLSLVHGLVTQSGGSMRISSRLNVGTTVELWFPSVEHALQPAPEPATEASAHTAPSCCVLVVDDDFLVAEGTAGMLKEQGYGVLVALSGVRGLEIIRSEPQVGLVIADYAMPEMTGVEFARQVLQFRPNLPIILATGYSSAAPADDLQLPRLNKPYGPEEATRLISKLLLEESVPRDMDTPDRNPASVPGRV